MSLYDPGMPKSRGTQLTIPDIADRLGITSSTWTAYVVRGTAPPADGHLGRTPWWWSTTIEAWVANRPGSGRWGKRGS